MLGNEGKNELSGKRDILRVPQALCFGVMELVSLYHL